MAFDGLVHGWDLATAAGQHYEPSPTVVAAVDASPAVPSPPRCATRHSQDSDHRRRQPQLPDFGVAAGVIGAEYFTM